MNPSDIDIKFLNSAAFQIRKASVDITMTTRLLAARERHRKLEEAVENTKPGSDRSIANERRCEALAIVLDLERQIRDEN